MSSRIVRHYKTAARLKQHMTLTQCEILRGCHHKVGDKTKPAYAHRCLLVSDERLLDAIVADDDDVDHEYDGLHARNDSIFMIMTMTIIHAAF